MLDQKLLQLIVLCNISSRNDRSAMVPITQKEVIATIPSSYYSHRSLEAATVNGGQMSHFSADVHRNGIGGHGGHGGSFGGRRRRGRWLRRRNRRSRTRGRRNSAGVVISSSRLPALEDQNTLLVLTNYLQLTYRGFGNRFASDLLITDK